MNELAFFTDREAAEAWCAERRNAVLVDWHAYGPDRVAAGAACAAAARALFAAGADVAVRGDDYNLHFRHRLGSLMVERPNAARRLEAEDLVLRAWEEGDLDWVHRACQDGDIARWTNIPWPYGRGDARALLELSERGRRMGTAAAFAITSRDGERLGSASLTFAAGGVTELGYWVAAEARGRGAAPAAVERLVAWAVQDLGIGRVELKTIVGNRASERVAEKAGFEREGVLKAAQTGRDGGRVDLVMWSRTAPPAPAPAPGPGGTTPPGCA